MHKRALVAGIVLVTVLLAAGSWSRAAPLFQGQSLITYPTDGMTVSGQVEVKGIATHPNILWYQVDYAPGADPTGDSQWVSLGHVENTQVEDGLLAVWDTTRVPDGQYTLVLTVRGENDSLYYQYFVTHLAVNNAQPVATPTPDQQVTEEPLPTAVVGPTPTPVTIEQPATPTPRPSPTPVTEEGDEDATSSTGEDERPSLALDLGGLREGFCGGVWITTLLFLLWGLYLMAKASVRWFLRQRARPRLE